MTKTRKAAGVAALLLLTACPIPRELREVPPPPVSNQFLVSVEQLQGRLNDPGTVVLHVGRNRADYDAGHIPGARWLPLSSIVTERNGLPNELTRPVPFSRSIRTRACSSRFCECSARAAPWK